MNRFKPSLALRMYRDFCWYIRLFFSLIPDIIVGLASASALFILLPVMAAFVV